MNKTSDQIEYEIKAVGTSTTQVEAMSSTHLLRQREHKIRTLFIPTKSASNLLALPFFPKPNLYIPLNILSTMSINAIRGG